MADIVGWAESQYGFYVDRCWKSGRWALERGPIRLAEYHKRILRHVFTPGPDGRLPYDVAAWGEPAKSGKSAIAGLCAEYAALHLDGDVVLASNKKDQSASVMYKSLADSVEWNPHLPNVEPNRYEVVFDNGNAARAVPCNARGEAGARFSLAVFDELWGYTYSDSLRLWAEFKTDPTRRSSMKLATGYGGYHDSILWREVLEAGLRGEPVPELADIGNGRGEPACWRNGRHFTFWSHECRQPWQTDDWIASQRAALLPAEFSRMIEADFVASTQDSFVPGELWESCLDSNVRPVAAGSRTPIMLGLDLAAGAAGGDCIALAGVSRWGDGFAVRYARKWDPPPSGTFDYEATVVPALDWLVKNCRPAGLAYDPFQSLYLVQAHRERWLLPTAKFEQGPERELADRFLHDCIVSGTLRHFGDPDLTRHVLNAGVQLSEKTDRMRIAKTSRFAKVDLTVALSMAVWWARKSHLPGDPSFSQEAEKIRLQALQSEHALPEVPDVVEATRAAKLAAVAGRKQVTLKYIGLKEANLTTTLRPSKRTITYSARNPHVQMSGEEAQYVLSSAMAGEWEVVE